MLLAETGFGQALVRVDSSAPNAPVGPLNVVSGLAQGERLLGIDYRPATNQLYGLGDSSAIYTIDVGTGAASLVGTGFTDPINGTAFGFDFNPVIDRIRIVSDGNQNLVAHPDTGAANVAATVPVAYGAGDANEGRDPQVVHHAYDGNVANSPATQLRAIDTRLDMLVTQANNAGTLGTIGALGIDATEIGGFDIGAAGDAFAVFADLGFGTSTLYSIDLDTGAASALGSIGEVISGIAVAPVPVPAALPLLGAGFALLGLRRRRTSVPA
ncbi:MAG: DUF4394 domain-containing protein [Gammaproteobacteria bacterium]